MEVLSVTIVTPYPSAELSKIRVCRFKIMAMKFKGLLWRNFLAQSMRITLPEGVVKTHCLTSFM